MVQYHKLREMADFDVDNDNCLEMDELEGCPIHSLRAPGGRTLCCAQPIQFLHDLSSATGSDSSAA
jgi:hypothetical protein